MENCIFCKIIAGEIPSYKVYEDDNVFAFLDITPATKGHTLIIPKQHYENILDIPETVLEKISTIAKKLALKFEPKLNADGFNLIQSSKEAAQQEVMHFHMHLLPRYKTDSFDIWKTKIDDSANNSPEEVHKLLS